VQPKLRLGQQVVQPVAEAGCAGRQSVARVGALQAGREMRHDHCGAVEGLGQRGPQPLLADQRLLTHGFGQKRRSTARAARLAQVEIGGAKGLLARAQLLGQRRGAVVRGRAQRVEVAPQGGADKAHATECHRLALQPDQPQALAGAAQAAVGFIEIHAVVLVVTVKPGSSWDPTKYFNVWVLEFGGVDAGTLGYAQFPTIPSGTNPVTDMVGAGGAANTDGVVLDYHYVGNTGTALASAPYNKGRTLTHEAGHWLGLWHIWGDDGTSCTGTDYVTDTPNQADENYTCPTTNGAVSADGCAGSTGAMYQNYMDYSDDKCMVMFTAGQKARMQAVMANCARRLSLTTSTVCSVTGIDENISNVNLDVYPNPTNGELYVDITTIDVQDFTISVINTLGQTVKEVKQIQSNGGKIKIDLSDKNTGVYFVTVKSKSGSKVKRIVLQ
jgi:hypothetical protein